MVGSVNVMLGALALGAIVRRLTLFFLFLIAICGFPLEATAGKRVALVIGNSAYQAVVPLANPVRDATAVAEMFRKAGFDVVEFKQDMKNVDLRRALNAFFDVTTDADIAVVYYAGHGIEVDGVNYLVPVDAMLKRDRDVYDEAIPLDRVLQSVETARQLRLVILDACRDNPFARAMTRTLASRAIQRGLVGVEPTRPNTLVAFAAKGGSTAEDGASAHSPFTAALLKHLTVPGLDVRRALGAVRDEVIRATGNRQEPFVYGSLGGTDVVLVPLPSPPQPTAPATTDTRNDVRRDYELAERVGTTEAWDSFLRIHASGYFADLARAQRNKLTVDERRDVGVAAKVATSLSENDATNPARIVSGGAVDKAVGQKLATLPRQDDAVDAPTKTAAIAKGDIPRLLQIELQRVGCAGSAIEGRWGAGARRALASFNKHAGTSFEIKVASLDALQGVRAKSGRVCPLECKRGDRLEGDHCVKVTCDAGFGPDDAGNCRAESSKAKPAPAAGSPQHRRASSAKSPKQGKCVAFNGRRYCE